MNRTHALRVETLARRLTYLRRQMNERGPDHSSYAWLAKEAEALDWVLRLVREADAAGVFEDES